MKFLIIGQNQSIDSSLTSDLFIQNSSLFSSTNLVGVMTQNLQRNEWKHAHMWASSETTIFIPIINIFEVHYKKKTKNMDIVVFQVSAFLKVKTPVGSL